MYIFEAVRKDTGLPYLLTQYESPIGSLYILTDTQAVYSVCFTAPPVISENIHYNGMHSSPHTAFALAEETVRQLKEFFTGKRFDFDLPLNPQGTAFQKKVWHCLLSVPYGETRTYRDIAQLAGNPKAARAIGNANNKNPIAIIIPCHRIIGTDGTLTGYGGGLSRKRQLLLLEQHYLLTGR